MGEGTVGMYYSLRMRHDADLTGDRLYRTLD